MKVKNLTSLINFNTIFIIYSFVVGDILSLSVLDILSTKHNETLTPCAMKG